MTIFLPCGETKLQWDDENGIIIKFPDFAVKMQQDGSLIYPDGNFRKKIEDGNLIIEGEGLTMIHSGTSFEFKTDVFSFKMIDTECWEINGPIVNAKYTPDKIFIKGAGHWISYSNSYIETGFRGTKILLTDNIFQIKQSFLEILINNVCRYRYFNKELIPNEQKTCDYKMDFYEIPYFEMPKAPMQMKNKEQDITTAKERAIEFKEDEIFINRENFDLYYDFIKKDTRNKRFYDPNFVYIPEENEEKVEIEHFKKTKKKKNKKKKEKPNQEHNQNHNENENQNENMQMPLLENASQPMISQEVLPQDFAASQAISKINKLLEAGESIAYFTSAKIVKFLKPKRIRKIVITTSGRIFFTNIGGDGILGNIEYNEKSNVEHDGFNLKIHGYKKTFYFVFDKTEECSKCANKVNQCFNK